MRIHGFGVAALLLAAAGASVAGSTAALGLIGNTAISPGGAPLTNSDVHSQLATATPTESPGQPRPSSSSPQPTGTARPHSPPALTGAWQTSGGSVFASCAAGQATLTRWIPAQGYRTDDSSPGPGASARLTFTSASGEVTVTATCGAGGHPRFATSVDDNHGGGAGGGGGDEHGGRGGGRGGGGNGGGDDGGGGHGGDG